MASDSADNHLTADSNESDTVKTQTLYNSEHFSSHNKSEVCKVVFTESDSVASRHFM